MFGPFQFRLAAVVLAASALGCAAAFADDPQGPPAAMGGPSGPVVRGLVKQFDRDGDGQLDMQERQAATADILKRFDRNHNGRLDPGEQTAALVELGAQRPSPKKSEQASLERRLIGQFDEDRDGELDESERKSALKQLNRAAADRTTNRLRTDLLRRLDADGNGRLDRDELDDFLDPPQSDTSGGQNAAQKKTADERLGRSSASDRGN